MIRVFLVRHGQPDRSIGARREWKLSRFGRNQAEHAAEELERFGPLEVISGPQPRCRESADYAAKKFRQTVSVEPRLGEIEAPSGTADANEWLRRLASPEAGLKWPQLDQRVNAWRNNTIQAIRDIKADSAVYTHFASINAIMGAALHLDETVLCNPDHASITEFAVVNGDIRLVMDGKQIVGPNE